MRSMLSLTDRWHRAPARRFALRAASSGLHAAAVALEIYGEILPGVRMATGRRHLPQNLGAGLLGAEAATWWAISPSLLPRPWWATAANVAICQGVGHAIGTVTGFALGAVFEITGHRPNPDFTRRGHRILHAVMGLTTAAAAASSLWRQDEQAALVDQPGRRGRPEAIAGLGIGTLGFGAILLIAEANQSSITRLARLLRRWLPPVLSWPLSATVVTGLLVVTSDRVIVRQVLNNAARRAHTLNDYVFPGISQPREPERSGSAASLEHWGAVGSKGRTVLSAGPRARDIAAATSLSKHQIKEPIRVFIGLTENRTVEESVELAIRELERTGAASRRAVVVMSSAGSGWLSPWSMDSLEFLTGGDCAVVAIQYSYLPSAFAYVTDRDSPVASSRLLIRRVHDWLDELPEDSRPRLYVSGESLGGYGIADSFGRDELFSLIDGAVFSGVPGFTGLHRALVTEREHGSPERLPVVGGGRHVRFAAVPEHVHTDFRGNSFAHSWQRPRIVFAQHASDPVVFWDWPLLFQEPDWLREPGARGIPAPEAQRVDVLQSMRWAFFVTGWQVAVDQVDSLDPPGGHGHQYHREMLYYWQAVLGEDAAFELTEEIADELEHWIYADCKRHGI